MLKTQDFMEFREVENEAGTDADIQVYVLGTLVTTIKNAWTRPNGHVYCEKEACVRRVQNAIRLGWEQAGISK
jgi:hypothetical protein